MLILGKRIKQARELKGLTQESLAEMVGVSRTAIARWESGDIDPTVDHLIRMSNSLGVDISYLLGADNKSQMIETLINISVSLEQLLSMLEDDSTTRD